MPGVEEMQIGTKMIGRPAMSKSLFVNEAIIHFHDSKCAVALTEWEEYAQDLVAENKRLKNQLDASSSRGWKRFFTRNRR